MNQQERLTKILAVLEKQERVSQEELVSLFKISKDTARRDSLKLFEQGLVERYPGGISRPLLKEQIESYSERLITHGKAKEAIAKKAQSLVSAGATLYLDVSTTVNFLASRLSSQGVMLVTNSIDNALVATRSETTNQAYLLGGFFNPKSHILAGEGVLHQLQQFNFDYAFIGAAGISSEGIYYSELSDIYIKKTIIDNAAEVCLLIDSSKEACQTAFKLEFSGIDTIITETKLAKEVTAAIKAAGIKLIIIEEEGK